MNKYIITAAISLFVLLSALAFSFYTGYKNFLNTKTKTQLEFSLPIGLAKSNVAEALYEAGDITKSQKKYVNFYFFVNRDQRVDAGDYLFKEGTTHSDLLSGLKNGVVQVKVTFIEGWRLEENVLYLAQNIGKDFAYEYYTIAKDHTGKLFPDTYFISTNTTPKELVDLQLKTFTQKVSNLQNNTDLTDDQLLVIASIVERETNGQDDIPLIAGILIKRYLEGMALDADATTQYSLNILSNAEMKECIQNLCEKDFWPKALTESDLATESSYNTRGKYGLPPTPISNPSLKSLEAVFNPKQSSYYYYLHDNQGNIYYAVTLEQHIENIYTYL